MITALQKRMAKIYARKIYNCQMTLDDVKPQTEEYREYVKAVYKEMYNQEL